MHTHTHLHMCGVMPWLEDDLLDDPLRTIHEAILDSEVMDENAARFQWQMRDFRLWSLQKACSNYSINLLPTPPPVAQPVPMAAGQPKRLARSAPFSQPSVSRPTCSALPAIA